MKNRYYDNKVSTSVALSIIVIFFVTVIFGAYGYISNIMSLIHSNSITGMVVARAIGLFVMPLGIVLGYF